MMGDLLHDFPVDHQVGVDKQIEGVIHHAFGRVFDRHDPIDRAPAFHFIKHFFDPADRHVLGGRSEFSQGRQMRKRGRGPQVCHGLHAFQRQGGGHDFPIHRTNRLVGEGAVVVTHQTFHNKGLPPGGVQQGMRVRFPLRLADCDDVTRTLIEEPQDLIVQPINFLTGLFYLLLFRHSVT